MSPHRRQTPRVTVGADYSVRFVAGGHLFENIRLVNVSEGGCFITVPASSAGIFLGGTLLEQLRLEGPGLPTELLTGRVAFAMGTSPRMPMVGVGVSFLALPPPVHSALCRFVENALGLASGAGVGKPPF